MLRDRLEVEEQEETLCAGLQGKRRKERKKEKKWEEGGGVDEGISVLTRRERQQRRFSLARSHIGRRRRHTRR